jgi:hypothetical protein
MKSQYTFSPWFVDQYGHVYGWSDTKGTRESVLILDSRYSKATRADKNLIATAPELLEALEGILSAGDSVTFQQRAREVARAAIAKAKGKNK